MTVKYEQIQGRPINLRPMPLKEVRKLKTGDKLYVWWAKDGNPNDVRVNGICEVLEICPMKTSRGRRGVGISIYDGDFTIWDSEAQMSPDENCTDWAGRGSVYFYYA